ncbi:MAG: hypothetical protein Q9222_005953 [Ikaeria aurantiellina]
MNPFSLLAGLCFSLSALGIVTANSATCELGPGEESHTVGTDSTGSIWPWQIYQSSPFNPPELEISRNGDPLAEGLVVFTQSLFGPVNSVKEQAPLIMSDSGQLVWNGPITTATNLQARTYKGSPVLTYWSGVSTATGNIGRGYGNITFLDHTYRDILTVCPQLGLTIPDGQVYDCEADLHESFVTDRDTLLISAYNATPTDLSAIGGPEDGWVFDCLMLELEPTTGEVLFRWSAIEHVPVTETRFPLGDAGNSSFPFDFFHINSAINVGDFYLINARHTWSTYFVSSTGDIIWTLEGETGGDFGPLPDQGRFHHAIAHNVTNSSISITYFNNFASQVDNGTRPSTGLELQLCLPPSKSQSPVLLQSLSDPAQPIYDESQGSTQLLPNGNVFMDYGQIPILKEYGHGDPNGVVKWTARFARDNLAQSYRGFKQVWKATPYYDPSLVVQRGNGTCAMGYVSWNGATSVTGWQILEGASQESLTEVGKISHAGFETKFRVKEACIQAVALEGEKEVGKSDIACV